MTTPTRFTQLRHALVLGAACAAIGVLAWTWELLARQVPSSPWHVRGFPAAIERLALHAWIEALMIFAIAPRAFSQRLEHEPRVARLAVMSGYTGTPMVLASLAYAAATGVFGLQIRDTSVQSHGLFVLRIAGETLLLLALWIAVRAATAASRQPAPAPDE